MAGTALEPILQSGTHRATWTLSKPPDPETWQVPGEVDLQELRQPGGGVFGKAPVHWTQSGNSIGAGFPQRFKYPVVRGELDGGLDVVLIDAILTVSGEGSRDGFVSHKGANAYFDAWAALVGHTTPTDGPVLVDGGVIQVPYLEAFGGRSPLAEVHMPDGNLYEHNEPLFSATIDKSSLQTWRDDDAEVSLYYQLSADLSGWYSFGLAFSPVVSVELTTPIPLVEFLMQWAWPMRELIAAATGKRVDISYLTCSPVMDGDDRPHSRRQCQVFNASIAQTPYTSTRSLRDKYVSDIRLASDDQSLLELLRRWQALQAEENPILNTYDITAVGRNQHPRARYLLLLQALEGLCGHEKRFEGQQSTFGAERESVMTRCQEVLDGAALRFVKKYLAKRRPVGLDSVLREMLRALPVDVEPRLAEGALVQSVRSDDPSITSTLDALRVVRNNLSHGNKTYDRRELSDAADTLERVVRAHLLRLLGTSDAILTRVLTPER